MSIFPKKPKEKEVGDCFARYLSERLGYECFYQEDELDQECDGFIVKGDGDRLYDVQITCAQKEVISSIVSSLSGDVVNFKLTPVESIVNAINNKNYPRTIKKRLTLLVWSDFYNLDEEYLKDKVTEEVGASEYEGIYFIKPKSPNSYIQQPPTKGKVIKIS